jgi:pyridoxine 5-phosphate synthase
VAAHLASRKGFAMTVLSVNVNKVAVLRNSRGGEEPRVTEAARVAIAAGCGGITVHPRPDGRHIRTDDVHALAALVRDRVEFNIEGNPFAPPRAGYPGLQALVAATRPQQVTLVPDGDGQITSDHGFDPARDAATLEPLVAELVSLGARVSVFVDATAADFSSFAAIGVARVELYTGPYAEAFARGDAAGEIARHCAAALAAQAAGLGVNAGHDLSQANLGAYLRGVPGVAEVSIGHALFGEALYAGLDATVRGYLRVIEDAGRG